jgi:hypothetical protein
MAKESEKKKAPYDNPAPLVKIGYLLCQMAVEMYSCLGLVLQNLED